MNSAEPLRCGTWPSPLTPEVAAAGAASLIYAGAAAGTLYWIENRPAERGRSVLMAWRSARRPGGEVADMVEAQANVRSRVHEYGGMPWAAASDALVYSQFDDQRLRLLLPDGAPWVLTPPGCRYVDGQATPDGRWLVCVREDHRAAGEPRNEIVALDLAAAAASSNSVADEVSGGDAGCLLFGSSDFVASPRISPDGRQLAFIAWDHPAMPWDATRLMLGDLVDGSLQNPRQIAGGEGESVIDPQWDEQGRLYFLSDRSDWWNLYRWNGQADPATNAEAMTSLEAEIGAPMWQPGLPSYALGAGRALLRIGRGTEQSLALLDLATRQITPLELPYVGFDSPGLLDEQTAFAIAARADGPKQLILIDLHSGKHSVLHQAGVAPIPAEAVSRAQAVSFPTLPGPNGEARTAHGWFYPPHHPQYKPSHEDLASGPPLMVMLHGGPTGNAGPWFDVAVQFWTTRGFAVLHVNYGGSSGYGRAYRERLRGQWGVIDLQDAVAGVDWLAAAGLVDGLRVAIRGGSAGGFTVLSALAFSDRFAAGINYFGVADLKSLATDTHKFESRYLDGLVGPLPAAEAVYRARSPLQHMSSCHGALLTFQGSDDKAVPPQQSRDIVAAAQAAGCPVAYVEFEGEGHGFRQAANIARALRCEELFLGRVFGYTPPGDLPELQIHNEAALAGGVRRLAPAAGSLRPAP